MDVKLTMRVEIETLHELLDEVDYYRLLRVDRHALVREISASFRAESARMHPDRTAAIADGKLSRKANQIFRRLGEAHACLSDPSKRSRYDGLLKTGVFRLTDAAAAKAAADKRMQDPAHAATHPKAETYWTMALQDWEGKRFKSSLMNIKFALSFEPDNEVFKEWKAKVTLAFEEEEASGEKNPYKIRII
jgi:curved DNA-binding protein CbpA